VLADILARWFVMSWSDLPSGQETVGEMRPALGIYGGYRS
jgi:hypothetical protein